MSFEKITKGEFKAEETFDGMEVRNNKTRACSVPYRDREGRANAEFITHCFNLQQKLDIGCFEEAVRLLERSNIGMTYDEIVEYYNELKELLKQIYINKQ